MTTLHLLFKHEMIALDPNGFNSDSSSATVVLKMVCEGLTRFDHSGALAPGLALDWEASADLKRFTFRLDPAAEFQSGRPCDAEAVRACFARFLHPATNSLLAADYAGLERIDVPARHRLRFTFARPMPSFLPNLAWRTHIVDDTQRQPAGGTFRLAWWRRGEGIGLERAAADRTAAPGNIAAAEIRFAPSGADRLAIMAAGRADIAESLPGALARRLAAPDRLVVRHAPARHKTTLCFNMRRAVLDDVRLRRAFAHAVDRERLAATFGGEGSRVVDGLLGDLADGAGGPHCLRSRPGAHLLAAAGTAVSPRAAAAVAPVPDLAAAVADDRPPSASCSRRSATTRHGALCLPPRLGHRLRGEPGARIRHAVLRELRRGRSVPAATAMPGSTRCSTRPGMRSIRCRRASMPRPTGMCANCRWSCCSARP